MKKNKKVLVIAALLLLVTVGLTSYAIYKTEETVDATVRAAKWSVSFKDGSTEVSDTVPITFSTTDCPASTHKAAGVIAPGATCTKTITIDADDSEVSVHWAASAGSVTDGTNTISNITASLGTASGDILYSDVTRTATTVLTITWTATDDSPTDTINAADTALQNGTLTVPVTLTATQIVPTP